MQPMADFASRISGSLLLLALSGSSASAAELKFINADESRVEFERSVQPFLAKHCVECHGAKDPEGELDLTTLDPPCVFDPAVVGGWEVFVFAIHYQWLRFDKGICQKLFMD